MTSTFYIVHHHFKPGQSEVTMRRVKRVKRVKKGSPVNTPSHGVASSLCISRGGKQLSPRWATRLDSPSTRRRSTKWVSKIILSILWHRRARVSADVLTIRNPPLLSLTFCGAVVFCVWEAKGGISDEEMQAFIDGPDGPNWGLKAFNNVCYKVNTELNGGATPNERFFS